MVKLLKFAGSAVTAVTQSPKSAANESRDRMDFESKKDIFSKAASGYFSTLSSLDIRLRQQIKALEKAEVVPNEAHPRHHSSDAISSLSKHTAEPRKSNDTKRESNRGVTTGGGLCSLDDGRLNGRNDNKEMEAELWEEASRLVQNYRFTESVAPKQTTASDKNTVSVEDTNDKDIKDG